MKYYLIKISKDNPKWNESIQIQNLFEMLTFEMEFIKRRAISHNDLQL